MEMYFCPLFSGSSGNALFCQAGRTRILIDAGQPGSKIEAALESIGVEPSTLSGILMTHEHSDHTSGAGVLARRLKIPIYATHGTWLGMEGKVGKLEPEFRKEIIPGRDFYLGDMGVESYSVPHDAAEPVGYRLWGGELSVSTATDLGYFPEELMDRIAGSSVVLLESNHDPDMLRRNDRHSRALKERILGKFGHLSNDACAEALIRLIRRGTRTVILGHLSPENNTPELAMKVSTALMEREGIRPDRDVSVSVAPRDRAGRPAWIRERNEA